MEKTLKDNGDSTFGWKLVMSPKQTYKCFGCGTTIHKGSPKKLENGCVDCSCSHMAYTVRPHGGKTQTVRICLVCSMLAGMCAEEIGGGIWEGIFKEPKIANCNRKRKREILKQLKAGVNPFIMLREIVGDQLEEVEQ